MAEERLARFAGLDVPDADFAFTERPFLDLVFVFDLVLVAIFDEPAGADEDLTVDVNQALEIAEALEVLGFQRPSVALGTDVPDLDRMVLISIGGGEGLAIGAERDGVNPERFLRVGAFVLLYVF